MLLRVQGRLSRQIYLPQPETASYSGGFFFSCGNSFFFKIFLFFSQPLIAKFNQIHWSVIQIKHFVPSLIYLSFVAAYCGLITFLIELITSHFCIAT